MPVQYSTGIIKEHNYTRTHVGLFDVSYMGQIRLVGGGAAMALEKSAYAKPDTELRALVRSKPHPVKVPSFHLYPSATTEAKRLSLPCIASAKG